MNWYQSLDIPLISKYAVLNDLKTDVVAACIYTESKGSPWAFRYEPNFDHTINPSLFAPHFGWDAISELILQKSSFGLMQIMGAVARQWKFEEELSKLFTPEVNLNYGCRHLASMFKRYGNEIDAIAAYNAGSVRKKPDGSYVNQAHVSRFMKHLEEIRNNVN